MQHIAFHVMHFSGQKAAMCLLEHFKNEKAQKRYFRETDRHNNKTKPYNKIDNMVVSVIYFD